MINGANITIPYEMLSVEDEEYCSDVDSMPELEWPTPNT